MQITNQKRIAARLLGCGANRVWINPLYVDQVASAVQTDDIREFIDEGWILSLIHISEPTRRCTIS